MRIFPRVLVAVACVASLLGCESVSSGPDGYAVRDSAGVELVSNVVAGGWSADEAPRIVEELRIGTLDGDPRYIFGQVISVDVDEDGRIYAVDMQDRLVKVFGPDGEFLRAFGGSGDGPGEFGTPMTITVLKDEVRVLDASRGRIQRFNRDGVEQGRETVSGEVVVPYRLPSNSELLEYRQPAPLISAGGLEYQDAHMIRRSLTGEMNDTVLVMPAIPLIRLDGNTMRALINAPTYVWAVAGDRVLLAKSTEFRIEEWSLEGDLVRAFSLDVAPSPVSPSRREELLESVPTSLSLRANAEIYPFDPVINGAIEGPRNTRWISGREVRVPETERKFVWYIFDARGRFLGTVDLPPRFSPLTMRHDRIYGVQSDDLGVQAIVRLRIEGL